MLRQLTADKHPNRQTSPLFALLSPAGYDKMDGRNGGAAIFPGSELTSPMRISTKDF